MLTLLLKILNKKKKLQQCFKETMEDKKRFELELKCNEEFEDRALEIYRKAKDRIRNVQQSITLKEKEERMRRIEAISLQMFLEIYIYIYIFFFLSSFKTDLND